MTYRNPADLVREKTEPKPEIHEERQERAARLEEEKEEAFREATRESQAADDENGPEAG